ncbi:MAG: 16S rRNA (cytidine(1402)-2'-O)-methyltransferase [Nitrospiraceae bacterium]|nr:16S rRNA (cytidine(1402)-2'-O)-methyltransferase [Nitrospiraceae bacterium]
MAEQLRGRLYLVGTPIGNLEDITARAVRVLSEVDEVYAEDTRRGRALLSHLGIRGKGVHRHSEERGSRSAEEIAAKVSSGLSIALITDAGMPAISDPGAALVHRIAAEGLEVAVVPGPTAESAAVALSGVVGGPYLFAGFLRPVRAELERSLRAAAGGGAALVGYVSPHDIAKVVQALGEALGEDAEAVICRELTKVHEDRMAGTLGELSHAERIEDPRGEYVLVLPHASLAPVTEDRAAALGGVLEACLDLSLSRSERAKRLAALTGMPRSEIYARLH